MTDQYDAKWAQTNQDAFTMQRIPLADNRDGDLVAVVELLYLGPFGGPL